MRRAAVLAVDGGGSKTDVALLGRDGRLLAAVRAGGASFHPNDHGRSLSGLVSAVADAASRAGLPTGNGPVADQAAFCLAGADLPADERRMLRALRDVGLAERLLLRNDTFAVLRAGTDRGWGIGVVCGTGLNCAGVAPDGRTVRFPALGAISGDWGGGGDVAVAAVAAAARARDGRGPRTALEEVVTSHFGMRRPVDVVEAVYLGRIRSRALLQLAPAVMRAADAGDEAAERIVDRLSGEVVDMVRATVRRLRVARRRPDVVLGGGVARSRSARFHRGVRQGVEEAAPGARVIILREPPVVGAALLGLDAIGARPAAASRARRALTDHHST
jgi:N-acetylglucosamine kinase-like BadF-type ATPase